MGLIFGLILAFFFPLLFLGIIRKSDFYQIGQFHLILASLGWGVFAFLFASLTNTTIEISGMIDPETIEHFIAPVLEEVLKGLILLYFIRLPKFTYSVDGALYGFATGIGFAIFENFEYAVNDPSIPSVILRIFSANLVHASSTAIIGIALGVFHLGRTRIGAYTMLFVRGLFTAEMVSVWDRMQAKVRERSASERRAERRRPVVVP
jgi:RsiW-degrading membrane proteinase PrsW (M82 family)